MTTTRRLASPRDILRTVPQLMDQDPAESLILLPLDRGRGGAILRFDLPPAELDPIAAEAFASAVVGYACRVEEGGEVILVVWTERTYRGPGTPPWGLLEEALYAALSRAGIRVLVSLCRAGDGWGEFGCDDDRCPGFGPRPLEEVRPEGPVRAVSATSPRGIVELLLGAGSPQRRGAVEERLARLRRDETLPGRAARAWERRLASRAPSSRPLAVETAALALALLEDDRARRRWLADLVLGPERELDLEDVWLELLADAQGPSASGALHEAASVLGEGGRAASFDRARLEAAAAAARDLVGLAPDRLRPHALAVLAILEWARGRSSMAAECVARVQTLEPALDVIEPLAASVGWMAERGIVPPWFGRGLGALAGVGEASEGVPEAGHASRLAGEPDVAA